MRTLVIGTGNRGTTLAKLFLETSNLEEMSTAGLPAAQSPPSLGVAAALHGSSVCQQV